MENRSFMFLFPKERNHWELKNVNILLCDLQIMKHNCLGTKNPSTSSVHLTGVCHGRTNSQGFGDLTDLRGDRWGTSQQVTHAHAPSQQSSPGLDPLA